MPLLTYITFSSSNIDLDLDFLYKISRIEQK